MTITWVNGEWWKMKSLTQENVTARHGGVNNYWTYKDVLTNIVDVMDDWGSGNEIPLTIEDMEIFKADVMDFIDNTLGLPKNLAPINFCDHEFTEEIKDEQQ